MSPYGTLSWCGRYSGHDCRGQAVQSHLGTYVENPNIKVDWTQYAEHAAERMQQRGMTQELVNNIVENGKVLSQNNGNKFAYITQEGVAIVSKEGKLITAWSDANFDSSMFRNNK